MTTDANDPEALVDVDLVPDMEPADAADQERDAWDDAEDVDEILPDEERPVPLGDADDDTV